MDKTLLPKICVKNDVSSQVGLCPPVFWHTRVYNLQTLGRI